MVLIEKEDLHAQLRNKYEMCAFLSTVNIRYKEKTF